MTNIGIIIPTRNRPKEVQSLLACIEQQITKPTSITIVDSSDEHQKVEIRAIVESSPLAPRLVDHWPPSAAAQRNRGLEIVSSSVEWLLMLDDDITIAPDCLARLRNEVERLGDGYAAVALNPTDEDAYREYGPFHRLPLLEWLGLYSRQIGKVTPSGWHTRALHVKVDTEVEWLTSCATMWNTQIVAGEKFDEFFEQYSYLEDLEFSYRMGRRGVLLQLAGVEFFHHASTTSKKSPQWFGRVEVRNRIYFVRKHSLSLARCRVAMGIRIAMTAAGALVGKEGHLSRLRGNLAEVFGRPQPSGGL